MWSRRPANAVSASFEEKEMRVLAPEEEKKV